MIDFSANDISLIKSMLWKIERQIFGLTSQENEKVEPHLNHMGSILGGFLRFFKGIYVFIFQMKNPEIVEISGFSGGTPNTI